MLLLMHTELGAVAVPPTDARVVALVCLLAAAVLLGVAGLI